MNPVYIVLSQYKHGSPTNVEGYTDDLKVAGARVGAELPLRDYIYEGGKAGHLCGEVTKVFPQGGKETYDGEGNLYRATYDGEGNLIDFWTDFGFHVWIAIPNLIPSSETP